MIDTDKIKRLALMSPTVLFEGDCESSNFYNAASPSVVLELIAELEKCREVLKELHSVAQSFIGDGLDIPHSAIAALAQRELAQEGYE